MRDIQGSKEKSTSDLFYRHFGSWPSYLLIYLGADDNAVLDPFPFECDASEIFFYYEFNLACEFHPSSYVQGPGPTSCDFYFCQWAALTNILTT